MTEQQRTQRPARILLAEDDREMRLLIAEQLRRAGYEVIECDDGQALLERLAIVLLPSSSPHEFDLVISDIRMPGVNGLEVLEGLHDYSQFPPIILMTAFGDERTHSRAQRGGAIATLDKPFHVPDLLKLVRETIERARP